MILQGSQRGGAKNLAQHLLKEENDHVEVHEIRGFIADDLQGAFNEAYALSRGTKAKQYLFSLSLNPPPEERVSTEAFEDAINRAERKLGLDDQPRAIVFHSKNERLHAHVVWSRIDPGGMKAIQLSHTKNKLMDVSRELYLEHGWKMPGGMTKTEDADPRNFTLAQWQQAKRQKKDPRAIKEAFQDSWAISDSGPAFANALEERGYFLARGDKKFVALDIKGEIYAVSKWVGVKEREAREKLSNCTSIGNIESARLKMASQMEQRLSELQDKEQKIIQTRLKELEAEKRRVKLEQQKALATLKEKQRKRWEAEVRERQERYAKGFRGFIHVLTGQKQKITDRNEKDAYGALTRDRAEKDNLVQRQLEERRKRDARSKRLSSYKEIRGQAMGIDRSQFELMMQKGKEKNDMTKEMSNSRNQNPSLD